MSFPTSYEVHEAIRILIRYCGRDPESPGLKETPDRVRRALQEMTSGAGWDPKDLFKEFDEKYEGMVVVRGIVFSSMCEHHMMPFSGVAHVGYVPRDKVVGLSKLGRLVDLYARRLQIQERMTTEIATAIREHLNPIGCGCVIEASHSCMACRGVRKHQAMMITDTLFGSFKEGPVRAEFLNACRN